MKENPPLRRIDTPTGGHYYVDRNDCQVTGVTTALNSLPKDQLVRWQMKKAIELALQGEGKWDWDGQGNILDYLIGAGDREANKAATKGTNAHDFCEQFMLDNNPDKASYTQPEQKHIECFLNFVEDYQPEPVLIEKVLTYIDPKTELPLYAGTMDLIAKLTWNDARDSSHLPNEWIDGETYLCDYKASAGQPRPSHALQLAAYRWASHYLDENGELQEMVPVDHGAVILLNGGKGESCYRMFKLDTSKVVFHVFRCLLTISNFSKIENRTILGSM